MAGDEVSAEALWYVGPGRAEIREERLKPLTFGKVRVRALYGAISRGTEALIAAGRVPVSEYQRMRAPFMAGNFPFPVKYGYSTIGRVEAGPEELIGRNVFALHPHQNLFDVPEDFAVPVPAEITLSRAVMAANMETALNATWDAAPGPFGRIAVIGAGVVGALVAFLCARIEGAEVTLVDIDRSREALAAALGVDFATPDAGARRLRLCLPHQRQCRGPDHRAQHRGGRSHHHRAQLVRLGHRLGAARRRVSQPAAEARIEPGRQGRALAAREVHPSAAARGRDQAHRASAS